MLVMMFREASRVKYVRAVLGLTQKGLADACGVSETTAGRWDREGVPVDADQENMQAFIELERTLPPDPDQDRLTRERISGALVDLPSVDLADLLADVKRRQLEALRRELETLGPEPPDPDAVADDTQVYADIDAPSQQVAG